MVLTLYFLLVSIHYSYANYDVIVFGSTPSGIIAAVSSSIHLGGSQVVLLSQGKHIGGMMSGGLGFTDTGGSVGESIIGGLALEFFQRVGKHYGAPGPEWYFEPHVAEDIFTEMLKEKNVQIEFNVNIEKLSMTSKPNPRITQITTTDGRIFGYPNGSSIFIDASYEGDLMAKSGVSYTVGREGVGVYGESLAGVRQYSPLNQFYVAIDPYDDQGKLLPLVNSVDPGKPGDGDNKVEAFNFRLCLTQQKNNLVPITEPPKYDPKLFELFRRYVTSLQSKVTLSHFFNIGHIPNNKTDINNGGPLSTDCIGCSWNYPNSSTSERTLIWENHVDYTRGLLYFLGHDPSLPSSLRNEMLTWGYCADEFQDNDYFPYQLYVREARRMIGKEVFTQHNATTHTPLKENSIGCGTYNFDSHHVQRVTCLPQSIDCRPQQPAHPCCITSKEEKEERSSRVIRTRTVKETHYVIDEGDVQVNPGPFEIPYGVLLPKKEETNNLLVPVCVSSSHVGFCCLRLEPQFMIMGHSAGTAGAMAFKNGVAVQDINMMELYQTLILEGQILSTK